MTERRTRWLTALWLCALGACGGASTKVAAPVETAPPPPPEPPADALAWLPPEASVVGRIDLAAFRTTPFAEYLPEIDEASAEWLELDRIDTISVALEPRGQQDPSVVGVLEGRFEEGYLAAQAARLGAAQELHAERPVYVHEGTYWLQPRAQMLVGCTADYLDWVLGRYAAGPDAPLRQGDLYQALAPAVEFDDAHVAVLLQDHDGTARKALDEAGGAQAPFLMRALANVVRGAVRVQFGDGVGLRVLADVDSEAHAQQLLGMLQAYLDRWTNSPLILLLGLRDLLASIALEAQGTRVSLTAQVSQAQIDAIVERLKPMFEGLLSSPPPAATAPLGPVAPTVPTQPPPAGVPAEAAHE